MVPFPPHPPHPSSLDVHRFFKLLRARSQSNTDMAVDTVQFSALYCILSAAVDIFNPVTVRIFIVAQKIWF